MKNNTSILATWDDHDYGWNDAGKYYKYKEESKKIFLDFFEEPITSERRQHQGIYHSEIYNINDKTLQIILLDNRTFRSNLLEYNGEVDDDDRYTYSLDYAPHSSSDSTLLGNEQWIWLEKELQKNADLRLICSGTQFGIEYNGYEAWANFPHEQEKFIDLIKQTNANGVIFLTGDVHYAEISKIEEEGIYPIYDFTSSGLSSTWEFSTPNKNRIKGPIMENHFGLLTINWEEIDPKIDMEVWDVSNTLRFKHSILLSNISF
jgi:alkaline phosphatase D